jgi:hypothetical protein
MDYRPGESGHSQRVRAGTNAPHLETAIELYICAMGFVVMTQIGQFDKVLVQIYGLFAA